MYITRMDFTHLCRACLASKQTFEYRLFENVSVEIYEFCTSLQVNENDVLPKSLCDDCFNTITKLYEFKQMCSRSQNLLLMMPKQYDMESLDLNKDQTRVAEDNSRQNILLHSDKLSINENFLKEECGVQECETIETLPKQQNVKEEVTKENVNLNFVCDIKQDDESIEPYSDYDTHEVPANSYSPVATNPTKRLKKKRKKKGSSFDLCAKPEIKDTKEDRLYLSTTGAASSENNVLGRLNKVRDHGELRKIEKKGRRTRQRAEGAYCCDLCNRKFNLEERLQAHKLNFHEGKESAIECGVCGKRLRSWEALRYHRRGHEPVPLATLRCADCGKVFKSPFTLQKHRKLHDATRRPVVCYVCGIYLKTAATFQAHIETHNKHRERTFACSLCSKKFYTSALLTTHVTDLHGSKSFTCDYCQLVFARRKNIIQHISTIHLGVKPYTCDYCPRSFARLGAVRQHRRVHTGERPYPCAVCPKRFASKPQLVNHARIHTGEKPHSCKLCDKSFIQRSTLVRHMKVHK